MTVTNAPNSAPESAKILHIGHSPDPDDAFMWYPLLDDRVSPAPTLHGEPVRPKIDTGPYAFVHLLEDIETLNQRSEKAELEITALSIHQYAHVADRYALTSCGSSMGDGYGPKLVVRKDMYAKTLADMHVNKLPRSGTPLDCDGSFPGTLELPWTNISVAVPGYRTTAFLALSLLLRELGVEGFDYAVVPFDEIIDSVCKGDYDCGLIIHEGQLTYKEAGLRCLVDLGKWWGRTRKLPLPLGGNAIRRDLGPEAMREVCSILHQSIEWAIAHRAECLSYAMGYARDISTEQADKFVGMYVNKWTLDYGELGRSAVQRLLLEAAATDLVPSIGQIDFVEPLS